MFGFLVDIQKFYSKPWAEQLEYPDFTNYRFVKLIVCILKALNFFVSVLKEATQQQVDSQVLEEILSRAYKYLFFGHAFFHSKLFKPADLRLTATGDSLSSMVSEVSESDDALAGFSKQKED